MIEIDVSKLKVSETILNSPAFPAVTFTKPIEAPEYTNTIIIKDFNPEEWGLNEVDTTLKSYSLATAEVPEIAAEVFTDTEKEKNLSLVELLEKKTISIDTDTSNFTVPSVYKTVNLTEIGTWNYWSTALTSLKDNATNFIKSEVSSLVSDLLDWATSPSGILSEALSVSSLIENVSLGTFSNSESAIESRDYETNINRNYSSPIQVLLGRYPDIFSNMYDLWFAEESDLSNNSETAKMYCAKIEGIDIPQPKRTSFQRQALGMTLEIPKTEVTYQKMFTLKMPIDSDYKCFMVNEKYNKELYSLPVTGTLRDFFFKNKKTFDLVVRYSTKYSTGRSSTTDYDFSATWNSDTAKKAINLAEPYLKSPEYFDSDSSERFFVFRNVRCLGDNSADIQYTNQAANNLNCELKFTFRKVEELKEI